MRLKVLIIVTALILSLAPLVQAHGYGSTAAGNVNAYNPLFFVSGPDSDPSFTFIPFSPAFTRVKFEPVIDLIAEPSSPKNKAFHIPVPASLLLFGTGLLGLALRLRNHC